MQLPESYVIYWTKRKDSGKRENFWMFQEFMIITVKQDIYPDIQLDIWIQALI